MHGILQAYKGTHNFHNFTAGVSAREAAAKRYMQSLTCDAVLHIQVRLLPRPAVNPCQPRCVVMQIEDGLQVLAGAPACTSLGPGGCACRS